MSGHRRKYASGQGTWWHIQWVDGTTFKVECEHFGLTDGSIEEWGQFMDAQFEKRFKGDRPRLTASTLNFSRNELGNEGIAQVVNYLSRLDIGVQMIKLFKNNIGDEGAYALGQLIAHSHEPVHEVHLSHNQITEKGACSILESIARSRRYPYAADRSGRKDMRGLQPLWLRIEHNCINWNAIEHRLDQSKARWCAAESRDGWIPKDVAPMVCMHQSYRNQKEAPLDGQDLLAALHSGNNSSVKQQFEAKDTGVDEANSKTSDQEDVPMYIFLDASAVSRMMTNEGKLFSFQGLLNLCQQGHMKCMPPKGGGIAPEEHERIIFVVTDSVLDELQEQAERNPGDRENIEWLRHAPDSYLTVCHNWGILEVLETKLHMQLMKLQLQHEQRALEMGISKRTVKMFDFACLWKSQIESEGKVFFVTADEAMYRFGEEVACDTSLHSGSSGTKPLIVFNADDVDRRFLSGCSKLYDCALKQKASKFCGTVLSASLVSQVIDLPSLLHSWGIQKGDATTPGEVDLHHELREAIALVSIAQRHMAGDSYFLDSRSSDLEVTKW
eukprot:CAMPEP_0169070614 /NCGR_PEP_ID=MMETSP1015-20121227/5208_1 /TAXON_ID=342587 /ORGANISM="Karlodinium micrum, Strain CCMP2283" /LENGTH=555 /DNA_ID=CAMNT_0009129621 /DNA_START=64 /DNA_END=1728 /DNA_ORIENTATION=-